MSHHLFKPVLASWHRCNHAIALATEVLDIAQQFPQVPMVQRDAEAAIQVLEANGVDADVRSQKSEVRREGWISRWVDGLKRRMHRP